MFSSEDRFKAAAKEILGDRELRETAWPNWAVRTEQVEALLRKYFGESAPPMLVPSGMPVNAGGESQRKVA